MLESAQPTDGGAGFQADRIGSHHCPFDDFLAFCCAGGLNTAVLPSWDPDSPEQILLITGTPDPLDRPLDLKSIFRTEPSRSIVRNPSIFILNCAYRI